MKKVIILKGLPGSGKSTWAKQMLDEHPGQYKRVNKDDLRAMLDNSRWSKANESFILTLRNFIIVRALLDGKHVIVDDTNFAEKHEQTIKALIKDFDIRDVEVEVKSFDTPVDECIRRDLARANSVGERVIRKMSRQFLPRVTPPDAVWTKGLPQAIICDIDGTIALKGERSPYDWAKVGEDTPNSRVVDIVRLYAQTFPIILVSGRDNICRNGTEAWLDSHSVPYTELHMREAGNTEKDAIIKKRIFDEKIAPKYNVMFVLDDRDQVVEMWRSLGLTCLQVAEGDF